MTSKEILQKLSEKPEDAEDDKSADKPESAKAVQKTADQNTGESENAKQKRQKDLQEEEANAADPARSTLSSEEAQADEHSYSGEDEEEGGWIEYVIEDGQNDRR